MVQILPMKIFAKIVVYTTIHSMFSYSNLIGGRNQNTRGRGARTGQNNRPKGISYFIIFNQLSNAQIHQLLKESRASYLMLPKLLWLLTSLNYLIRLKMKVSPTADDNLLLC